MSVRLAVRKEVMSLACRSVSDLALQGRKSVAHGVSRGWTIRECTRPSPRGA